MVYCYVHLEDEPRPADGDEEVFIIVPDTSKIALAVPLDALPEFLSLLQRAVGDLPAPKCPACTATMPCRVVCSSAHSEPPYSG